MSIDDHYQEFREEIRRYSICNFAGILLTAGGSVLLWGTVFFGSLFRAAIAAAVISTYFIGIRIWQTWGRKKPWYEESLLFPWLTGVYPIAATLVGGAVLAVGIYLVIFLRNPRGWPVDRQLLGAGSGAMLLGLGILCLAGTQTLLNLRYDLMVVRLGLAINESPAEARLRELRMQLNCERREFAAAICDLSALIQAHPNEARYYSARARMHALVDEHKAGIADLTAFLKLAPRSAAPYLELGEWLPDSDEVEAELADWAYTLAHNPDRADLHAGRGATHEAVHRLEEALADYQKAARLKPDEAYYRYDLAIVLADLGRLEEATGEIERIRQMALGIPVETAA